MIFFCVSTEYLQGERQISYDMLRVDACSDFSDCELVPVVVMLESGKAYCKLRKLVFQVSRHQNTIRTRWQPVNEGPVDMSHNTEAIRTSNFILMS